jgi:small GTP-binding protein
VLCCTVWCYIACASRAACHSNLAIWDTAGEEKFDSLTNFYCRSAKAAILCYDITVRETFLRLNRWVQKIEDEAGDECAKVFVGTKLDVVQGDPSLRKVSEEEAKAYAESKGCVVIETSARTGENIDAAYRQAVSEVLKNLGDMGGGNKNKLDLREQKSESSDGCC